MPPIIVNRPVVAQTPMLIRRFEMPETPIESWGDIPEKEKIPTESIEEEYSENYTEVDEEIAEIVVNESIEEEAM